jgi:RNA polymerase sigma-70 factor (sigma-E family)
MSLEAVEAVDFATYLAARRPHLLRTALAITGDPSTAEDLLHTALASVLPKWDGLRHPGAADAYIRRAMVNRHHSWYRQPSRRRERPVAELPEPIVEEGSDPVLAADLHARLWDLVTQLPPRQRAAVVLRHYEGLSEAEVARALGCSVGTVKSGTSRGLATLRRHLAEDPRCVG